MMVTVTNSRAQKIKKLKDILRKMNSVVIAYSGGVDSTFLLKIANDVLKNNVLAVTARSDTYPYSEYQQAKKLAESIGVEHLTIQTDELENKNFKKNYPNRCYYCKKQLFLKLKRIAKQKGFNFVIDGLNFDDRQDFRPGIEAASEFGIRSPLLEAKLTKEDIRRQSKKLGLLTWDKPSFACLASRFPYGVEITKDRLSVVEEAEEFIKLLGIKQVRLRYHHSIARVEIETADIPKLINKTLRKKISDKLHKLGFKFATLDLDGYRTGSLNP